MEGGWADVGVRPPAAGAKIPFPDEFGRPILTSPHTCLWGKETFVDSEVNAQLKRHHAIFRKKKKKIIFGPASWFWGLTPDLCPFGMVVAHKLPSNPVSGFNEPREGQQSGGESAPFYLHGSLRYPEDMKQQQTTLFRI